ncbi:MAG TPA: saccharopine dehydrogenase NADP-binding domain-containing protein [Thermoanaerobaculia bacterium]|nr:saccharopine dehydrogenase NADP-binding domain-containing protein [Thermoanaerobaculia bacterium]
MDTPQHEFDVVVFGATGFTGRLVAELLYASYGATGELRWAIGGRDRDKLERLRAELGGGDLPLVVAHSEEPASLVAMVRRTRVVCTTVGPYALYGSNLVEACAREGRHYCDLTGEVQWMRAMIDAHQDAARASGARIVHSCGFDSIPFDLGVLFLQEAMLATHGVPARHVKGRVAAIRGGMSGGTAASMIQVLEESSRAPAIRRLLADPYALDPAGSPRGPDRNDQTGAVWDGDLERWTVPFVMAGINTRIVRRSHALLGHPWGEDFRYDEAMLMPEGQGALRAKLRALAMTAGFAAFAISPLRAVAKWFLPEPGEGPGPDERLRGFFDILFHGVHERVEVRDRKRARAPMTVRVTGDRDPGYGSTSKMLAEAAVCLAKDELECEGGFWTPASAMGRRLIDRLQARAGLLFSIVDSGERAQQKRLSEKR